MRTYVCANNCSTQLDAQCGTWNKQSEGRKEEKRKETQKSFVPFRYGLDEIPAMEGDATEHEKGRREWEGGIMSLF